MPTSESSIQSPYASSDLLNSNRLHDAACTPRGCHDSRISLRSRCALLCNFYSIFKLTFFVCDWHSLLERSFMNFMRRLKKTVERERRKFKFFNAKMSLRMEIFFNKHIFFGFNEFDRWFRVVYERIDGDCERFKLF